MKRRVELEESSLKALGILLRYNRVKSHLTLRSLGDLTKISHSLISNIETGKITPSKETLKELLEIFNISFYDDADISKTFSSINDDLLGALFFGEFTQAKSLVQTLKQKEDIYRFSKHLIDYKISILMYYGMLDSYRPHHNDDLETLYEVYDLLDDYHKQFVLFIKGLDLLNQYQFKTASDIFDEALMLGPNKLCSIIKVFKIQCLVRRYLFMDAMEIAQQLIEELKEKLNYNILMLARAFITFGYISVKKYDQAYEMLSKIKHYAESFDNQYLLNTYYFYMAFIKFRRKNIPAAKNLLHKVTVKDYKFLFLQFNVALSENNIPVIKETYNSATNINRKKRGALINIKYYELVMTGLGLIDKKENYLSQLLSLIDLAKKGQDQFFLEILFERLVKYYKSKRLYKNALKASQEIYKYRTQGFENDKH